MKLKTLKDLEKRQNLNSFICINPIEIRQEAVKWIKELEQSDLYYCAYGNIPEGNDNVVSWIKDFFNISEEDLK